MADDAQRAKYAYHRGALDRGGGANAPATSGVDSAEVSVVDSMLFRGGGMGFDRDDVPTGHLPLAGQHATSIGSRVPARGHIPPQYVTAYNTSPHSRASAASRVLGPAQPRVGVLHGVSVGPQPAAYSPSGDIMAMINNVTTTPVPLHASSAAGVAQLSGRGGPAVPGSSVADVPSPYSGAVAGGAGGPMSGAGPYSQVTPSLQALAKSPVQSSHLLPSRGNTFLMSSADFPALLGGPVTAGRGRSGGKGRDASPASSQPAASSTIASFRTGDFSGQRRLDHSSFQGDRVSDSPIGSQAGGLGSSDRSVDSSGPGFHKREVLVGSGALPAQSVRSLPVQQPAAPQQHSVSVATARLRRAGGVSEDQQAGLNSSSSQVGAAALRSDVESHLPGAVAGEEDNLRQFHAHHQQAGSAPLVVTGRHDASLSVSRGGSGRSEVLWPAGAMERGSSWGSAGLGPSQAGKYGMEGLLRVIQMKDVDLNTLALGTDLTSLGLNLNSPDSLHTTFASPWADAPYPRDVPFTLPSCYRLPNPIPDALSKVEYFSDDTLFYIFYALLQSDPLHSAAIRELYDRGWTLHRDTGAWMQMPPGSQGADSGASERGVLQRLRVQMLDVNAWERVSREIAVPPAGPAPTSYA